MKKKIIIICLLGCLTATIVPIVSIAALVQINNAGWMMNRYVYREHWLGDFDEAQR
ncbi:MAG: hypothetical protein FWC76_03845 [Defluviitaleaceae bacterium]|nr:hypothetical protein [Defluviitaleaceae bacterium]